MQILTRCMQFISTHASMEGSNESIRVKVHEDSDAIMIKISN